MGLAGEQRLFCPYEGMDLNNGIATDFVGRSAECGLPAVQKIGQMSAFYQDSPGLDLISNESSFPMSCPALACLPPTALDIAQHSPATIPVLFYRAFDLPRDFWFALTFVPSC